MSFDALLEQIKERAANSAALGSSLKFDMDGTIVHIDGKGEANVVSTEDLEADCTVKVSQENFNSLMDGNLNPMMAFMSGKIKIDGDMGVAMKLQSLLG